MQIQSISAALAPKAVNPVNESHTPTIIVVNDPLAITLEMAEEIGFIRAEQRRANKSVASEDADETFKDLVADTAKRALEEQSKKVTATELARQVGDLLSRLPPAADQAALKQLLMEYSKGSSTYNLLLLTEIVGSGKAATKGYTPQMLRSFTLEHLSELTAFVNIAPTLANLDVAQGNQMVASYENAVVRSASVIETFSNLHQSHGLDKVDSWRDFLVNAIALDLTSVPHSAEPAQLQLLLKEMQHFYIYNTLVHGTENVNRHVKENPIKLPQLLDYLQFPSKHYPDIASKTQAADVQTKILFHQDFRTTVKDVTERAFANPQQKTSAILLLQNKIDDLVWSEENV